MLNKKFVYVDSTNRVSGTHSRFKYNLSADSFQSYDSICVLQLNVPKSYYMVEDGENTFTLKEGVSTATITIPAGNYNRTNLKTVLIDLLNSASPNAFTYNITTPASSVGDTGKYTFTVTGNSGTQPALIFTDYIAGLLGFDLNTTNNFSANSLVSTNVCKLQLEDSVYLHSSLVNNGTDDILQDVFAVSNPNFSNIVWQCPEINAFSKKIRYHENVAEFYLTDEQGVEIDLQGQNVVFTLLLYKADNISELIRRYIKLNLIKDM